MPFVSITRLRIRSWRYLPFFGLYAARSGKQANSADGNLSISFLREGFFVFWTRTTWTAESAMKSYMISGAHGKVMRKLMVWCDEAATVHWTQDSSDSPSWEEAHRRLQQSGRPSKVNHPSPDQSAFRIAAPVVTKNKESRLK
jgi:Domain of unknown function (DUF3291)